jgi:hypothetical protein
MAKKLEYPHKIFHNREPYVYLNRGTPISSYSSMTGRQYEVLQGNLYHKRTTVASSKLLDLFCFTSCPYMKKSDLEI